MGSGRGMRSTLCCLSAFLIFSSLTISSDGSPLKVMLAPNLLRVGTRENIFVECQDCTGADIRVEISVMNHPAKSKRLAFTSVTLNSGNHFHAFGQIEIPAAEFSTDPNMNQYVYLQAQFPDQLMERVVLVSIQAGYIFIQTDKTIYTPESRVHYRIFGVTPHMDLIDSDGQTNAHIAIEIVTPEGIVFPLDPGSLSSGIYTGQYRLSEIASPGLWKLVAKFQTSPQQSYSAEFEVKEYVLPSFEVKLMPETRFFYIDSGELSVNIKATYLYGEEVNGMAYVVCGVITDGQKKSFPSSLQKVQITQGNGVVKLLREHITQTFPDIHSLVGSHIFVAVSVLTESGGEMVEAELREIKIVTAPYTINFKKTPKYFKPTTFFRTVVEVLNHDGTPAQGVAVVVNPGQVQGKTAANGIAQLPINPDSTDRMLITAKTNDPHISHNRQASATMVALPYTTKSNSYIHIVVDTAEVKLGDDLKVYMYLTRQGNQQNDITYLISRGQLLMAGRILGNQAVTAVMVHITKEMLPSFSITAYYHTNDNEVVADSVWVDVKDSCIGSLRLEPARTFTSYEPRRMFGLKVTGDPGATVGLVAVDESVYVLNNKHRLTQKKVWDTVEKYNTRCTPGGGHDSMGVFYDAGLLFESSASRTPHRTDFKCPALSRRKRDSSVTDVDTTDEEDDNSYMDSSDIVSRTHFPESWLWRQISLPDCPLENPNCDTTSVVSNVPLQDSITTWQVIGISLSATGGICVADPLEVIVQKEFFIDLRLPYSAVRGEQLEIKAILHNNSPDLITVRVDLIEEANVCSAAHKRGKYQQNVKVHPQTTQSVPFVIIPIKEGEHRIEVKAAVKDSSLSDGIIKTLRVVHRGILVKSTQTVRIDPALYGVDGRQQEVINSGIPKADLIPNTPTITHIFVTGAEKTGALVENVISGISMGSLIYRPSGSGETNMIHMTSAVIATLYLDKTNQWEAVGFEKRSEALNFINIGYQDELAFRKSDGSFAVFSSQPSSSWLTAYVAKVFTMANNLVPIQSSIICDAVKFLTVNAQQPDGMFIETGRIHHGEMMGDVRGADSEASMTAFCLIAMQESRSLCAATVNNLQGSIDKATHYLERRLPQLSNPYAVAMASYALANENKLNRRILYNFVSPDLSHWPVPKGNVDTLEATAYALLALVKTKSFDDARPIVRWLNQQQRVGARYGSIQATKMVYQAVAEYHTTAEESDYDLDVLVLMPGRLKPDRFKFNKENYGVTRTSKINTINVDVKVNATGTGQATVKMLSLYYTLPERNESDCEKFNLSVQLLPVVVDEEERTYKLKIDILYKHTERDATMTILDIGLLTGFTANTNDLDLLTKGHARVISKYEMNTALSERGSLIIYLDKVSHTRPEEITFRVHQTLKVGVLQPAAVSVYEYYDQTSCVKFYHPQRTAGNVLLLCRGDECTCAEENCSMQKKEKISNDLRIAKSCESTATSTIDFVYKVRVEGFIHGLSTDTFTMQVLAVIKEGRRDQSSLGKLRIFLSYPHCRLSLDLRSGKTYLVMGTSEDIHISGGDDQEQLYQYVLTERTWIEYWPTGDECQTQEHRETCSGIEDMIQQYMLFGCQE